MTTAFDWNPTQYGRFSEPRLRPALELLSRVHHADPQTIHDLGTGRGEMARAMADRWPEAQVTGSDLSESMLAEAVAVPSRVTWVKIDVRNWRPDEPHDVIYSNAMLHWVDRHAEVLPRLVSFLNPGGVLAIQMPLSWHEPSHLLMRETLGGIGSGAPRLGDDGLREQVNRQNVESASWYAELLAPLVAELDIWETRYLQMLEGDDPVFEWVAGSALQPILDGLAPDALDHFILEYRRALRAAYPRNAEGRTPFPFPRLFIVATR